MPELPEVETTRLGIAPHLTGKRVARLQVRQPRLRWPIPTQLADTLAGQTVRQITRRSKYLLLATDVGSAIIHLGMSGSLSVVRPGVAPGLHDHWDMVMEDGATLRLNDPRRFGCLLWTDDNPANHPLLAKLGPEPLNPEWDAQAFGDHLYRVSRGRKLAVKPFLMDSHTVVGVGNIYASESLFSAGIHPQRAAGRVSRKRYVGLAVAVQAVLQAALRAGGTTLRDFTGGDGKPGYFQQQLTVYGREGAPCVGCTLPITLLRQGQRASYYCQRCQR